MIHKTPCWVLTLVLTACQWPVADQFNNPDDRKAPSSVTYTLTVTNGLGGATTPSGSFIVNKGKATSILAQANEGYSFVNWTVPVGTEVAFGNAAHSSTTVALNLGNATVKANFGPITISTVAGYGNGTYGVDGGLATQSNLWHPGGTAVDSQGNLYIADTGSARIRRVDATTGFISTVAGKGIAGFGGDGGAAIEATLNQPSSVALDTQGNLFIADRGNSRVRKVNLSTGIIATVMGTGQPGYHGDGGPAIEADGTVETLALDQAGNIYIADYGNNRIRKVTITTGIISTVAGNGGSGWTGENGDATSAKVGNPVGVTLDSAENLYISTGQRICKVNSATGTISLVAGNGVGGYGGDMGPATEASFTNATGLAIDTRGNLYVADKDNHRIRRVALPSGVVVTISGNGTAAYNGDGGPAKAAQLNAPPWVTLDAQGNLYVTDTGNHRIRKIQGAGVGVGP